VTVANTRFAISVRDGSELFTVVDICRGSKGDVYVNFPRDGHPDWEPHSSYHASGQHHQKSLGHKMTVRHAPKPDASFADTENVVTFGIASHEPRAINTPCRSSDYANVFEIPIGTLSSKMYQTQVSVDLSCPSRLPVITGRVILQRAFQDRTPWILVTLFHTELGAV
jgi:hypothetical protein